MTADPTIAGASSPESDESLLAAFARGDRGALGRLAERHEAALLGLASALLAGPGGGDRARDAIQEVWVRVIRHARSFRGTSSVKTWLYRIAINRCRDALANDRRVRSHAGPLDALEGAGTSNGHAGASPPSPASDAETLERVRAALAHLPVERRMILLLSYHSGLTHEQAADVLDIPVGTLKSRLNTALRELRSRVSEQERASVSRARSRESTP